jgi:CPA1 family monovalent cation:H+ antiporter
VSAGFVLLAIVAFGVPVLAALLARRLGFSYLIALTVIGLVEAAVLPPAFHFKLTPAVLNLFLPALLFEGALEIDPVLLRRTSLPIVVLAVPGVLVTIAVVGAAAHFAAATPWISALVLGAIVSATDPVAVLGLFRRIAIPRMLLSIVEGESIANDGVAAALTLALASAAMGQGAQLGVWPIAVAACFASAIGIAAGICAGAVAALMIRTMRGELVTVLVTVALAYGAFVLGNAAGGSGIFASVAAGIAVRRWTPGGRLGFASAGADRFWDAIAFAANAAVFWLVGLSLNLEAFLSRPVLLLAVLGAVIVARAILAYGLVPLRRLTVLAAPWRHTIALAGIRGGLALALALGLPLDFPARNPVLHATFAVVFVTLVLQGALLPVLLGKVRYAEAAETAP